MLKLIRLFPDQDLFTVQGYGVQPGAVPVGTLAEASRMLRDIGVPANELLVAAEFMRQRPEHNAIDFGVTALRVTSSLLVDTAQLHLDMGVA